MYILNNKIPYILDSKLRTANRDGNSQEMIFEVRTKGELNPTIIDDISFYDAEKLDEVAKQIGSLASGIKVKVADIDGKNDFTYELVENSENERPEQG